MNKHSVRIGLLGLGNVGTGVLNILMHHADMLEKRTGKKLQVKTVVVKDLEKSRALKMPGIHLSTNPDDVLNDPDIQIVVEAMGGEYPAYDYIVKALKSGKFVVTANKEVVSKHKKEFFELAKKHKVDIYFEASVGGGIPLIRSLKVGFAANKINYLYGIVNGTTNYILTQIEEKHKDFADALKEAQKLGFAEAEPSMDISGLDTAYKLTILAAVAFKTDIHVEDIHYEGIEKISLKDIIYAKELGYVIKLLAIGYCIGDEKMAFKVHPTMIPLTHPLSGVRDELNAIFIVGDAVGESMLSGRGAGGSPTGSAVVSDIIDIAFDTQLCVKNDSNGLPHNVISGTDNKLYLNKRNLEDELQTVSLIKIGDTYSQFYIRMLVADSCGTMSKITEVLGTNEVSLSKIIQKDSVGIDAEIVIVTHKVKEAFMQDALKELENLPVVKKIQAVIRVGLEEV
jgi:homoserine dehydrogenase